jgi:hypothetical protein
MARKAYADAIWRMIDQIKPKEPSTP